MPAYAPRGRDLPGHQRVRLVRTTAVMPMTPEQRKQIAQAFAIRRAHNAVRTPERRAALPQRQARTAKDLPDVRAIEEEHYFGRLDGTIPHSDS